MAKKETKNKKYKLGEVLWPLNSTTPPMPYEVVKIETTWDFFGKYGTDERREVKTYFVYVARCAGSCSKIDYFHQEYGEEKWTRSKKESWLSFAKKKEKEAASNMEWVKNSILMKEE